ncbi:sialoadhesin-like isoform X2 [Electrophorus electricus]|uniref:sialoadhesin-like isoform X2 n=1 Tax=Electrophorus electricus TaxID=8005 RepID=UPI0015D05CBE|nr:sialoadhesin-like isoform X2 [Electrophorus electricus]
MHVHKRLAFCWLYLQVIFASVLSDVWKAEVVSEIEALVTSCVVIPCKFQYPGTQLPDSRVRGIWHKQKNQREIIYHEDSTNVVENFKGRTKLLGSLGQKNCTLEIDDIRNHDNGPFCFRAEIPTIDKYSFEEKCVSLSMLSNPREPVLEQKKMYFVEGQHALFKCSVRHTCPSHPPKLTWSRSEEKPNILHFIIPVISVVGAIIFFVVMGFFVIKKYKRQIQELQSRNENGLWSRISRVSRRFRNHRRPETGMDVVNKSNNCMDTMSGMTGFSKPRFPSPKSEQKNYNRSEVTCSADYDDDYTNTADLNVYGNL